jgi:F0F1-type ATP synthase assembly protein I
MIEPETRGADPKRTRRNAFFELAFNVGPLLAGSALAGWWLGGLLDSALGTSPAFVAAGVILAGIGTLVHLVRTAQRME